MPPAALFGNGTRGGTSCCGKSATKGPWTRCACGRRGRLLARATTPLPTKPRRASSTVSSEDAGGQRAMRTVKTFRAATAARSSGWPAPRTYEDGHDHGVSVAGGLGTADGWGQRVVTVRPGAPVASAPWGTPRASDRCPRYAALATPAVQGCFILLPSVAMPKALFVRFRAEALRTPHRRHVAASARACTAAPLAPRRLQPFSRRRATSDPSHPFGILPLQVRARAAGPLQPPGGASPENPCSKLPPSSRASQKRRRPSSPWASRIAVPVRRAHVLPQALSIVGSGRS